MIASTLSKATLYAALTLVATNVFTGMSVDHKYALAAAVWLLNASPESFQLPAAQQQRFYAAGFLALVAAGFVVAMILWWIGASFTVIAVTAGLAGFIAAAVAHWYIWYAA